MMKLRIAAVLALSVSLTGAQMSAQAKKTSTKPAARPALAKSMAALETELAGKYGAGQRDRLHRGIEQVARFWRAEDGNAKAFEEFVRASFAGDQTTLDALFARIEFAMESLEGHMVEINRDFRMHVDLDRGPIYAFDETLAGYDPSAHTTEDFFGNKLAFIVLLNFPLTTLEQRLTEGEGWSRRQWAEARLAGHEAVAAAVAGHAQEKRLQVLVDAESKCALLDFDLRLDLPPLAVHAQAPVVSHARYSFTDQWTSAVHGDATSVPAENPTASAADRTAARMWLSRLRASHLSRPLQTAGRARRRAPFCRRGQGGRRREGVSALQA